MGGTASPRSQILRLTQHPSQRDLTPSNELPCLIWIPSAPICGQNRRYVQRTGSLGRPQITPINADKEPLSPWEGSRPRGPRHGTPTRRPSQRDMNCALEDSAAALRGLLVTLGKLLPTIRLFLRSCLLGRDGGRRFGGSARGRAGSGRFGVAGGRCRGRAIHCLDERQA